MSDVVRETTIEKVSLPTKTVVEGEPEAPNEVAPEDEDDDEDE